MIFLFQIIKDFFGKNAYSNQYGSDFKFKPDITNETISEIKDYKNKHFIITNSKKKHKFGPKFISN